MRKPIIYIGIAVVMLVALVLAFGGTPTESNTDLLVSPERGLFESVVTVTGELQAKNSVDIHGPQSARSARIGQLTITRMVPEGTVVQEGDFVAELDRTDINAQIADQELDLQKVQSSYTQTQLDTTLTLSRARDDLVNLEYAMEEAKLQMEESAYEAPSVQRQAEINYEKAVRAYNQAITAYKTQVEQAKAQMLSVEADLQQARERVNTLVRTMREFTVYAPADGMVIYVKEYGGQKITENSQIRGWDPVVATLPDLSVMESLVYISEVDIQKVQRDQQVRVGLDAYPDKKLTGRVTEIANVGEQRPNSDSKVFEVKIQVNESDTTLRPAMTTSNEIIIARQESALHIPLECIHTQDSLTFVYKKAGGGAVKQEVAMGLINEDEAVIEAGLTELDQVYLSTPEGAGDFRVVLLETDLPA